MKRPIASATVEVVMEVEEVEVSRAVSVVILTSGELICYRRAPLIIYRNIPVSQPGHP